MNQWHSLAGVVAGLVLVWVAMIGVLYVIERREKNPTGLGELLRLIPDVSKLLRRLAQDRDVPRGVRWRLVLLLGYLLLPIDLVPDFIPVVGYADDAIVVVLVLRSVVRVAGVQALDRHWDGTPQGLEAAKRCARI